jgi:hypothetical protein
MSSQSFDTILEALNQLEQGILSVQQVKDIVKASKVAFEEGKEEAKEKSLDLTPIAYGSFKYKKDQEIEIVHPFYTTDDDSHLEFLIKVKFEGETLEDSVPHGLCRLSYSNEDSDHLSFEGFATMTNGKLHGGPALLKRDDGFIYSFDQMKDGRPNCKFGKFYNDDSLEHVDSLESVREVGGWAGYVGGFKDGFWHGQGKLFSADGHWFQGEWYKDLMKEGIRSDLSPGGQSSRKY